MRIIGGSLKGRTLKAPTGQNTRPTSDRTREAIFNIVEHAPWSHGIRATRVLDLFAGTGALGIEALSRGAEHCLFVETDRHAQASLRGNIEALSLGGVAKISPRDATDMGNRPHQHDPGFGLVFLDPPYNRGLAEKALAALLTTHWIESDSLLVWERAALEPATQIQGYELLDERTYGLTRVTFLRPERAKLP